MRVQYKICIDAATMELRNVRPEVHLMCMYVYKHVCMYNMSASMYIHIYTYENKWTSIQFNKLEKELIPPPKKKDLRIEKNTYIHDCITFCHQL